MKALLQAAIATALGLAAATAGAQTFRAADIHPDGYPTVEAVKYMGEILSQETDGRLGIQMFHSGQLGEEKDTIQQTQFGVIDINRINMAPLNPIIPETQVLALPFLFRSADHMHQVVDGEIGDAILAAFEEHGMIGLAFYDSGARSFYNTQRPIRTVEDMKGLKIRVQQSDLFIAMMEALGANPTPMPYGEVYSGLQTGVIDGAENNYPSYYSSRHFEVAKEYSLTEHTMSPEALVMSKQAWDKLSPEDQALVRQAAKQSVAKTRELWQAYEEESRQAVQEAGVNIIEVDKQPFIDAMGPVYDQFVTDDQLKELVARIRALD